MSSIPSTPYSAPIEESSTRSLAVSLSKPQAECETKESVYALKDGPGLVITDRLNGIMKTTFKGMLHSKPQYEISLNGKPLTFPEHSTPPNTLLGSQKITFERQDKLIKITETATNEYWVDDSECLVDAVPQKVYAARTYKPKEITLEIATSRVNQLILNHPTFKPQFIVYNRHGVAALGDEELKSNSEYNLYWANPDQAEMHKVKCSDIWKPGSPTVKEGFVGAKAADGSIYFNQKFNGSPTAPAWAYFLNSEPATEIVLPEKEENVYTLKEGPGLIVTDRLNGIMKVSFVGMSADKPQYRLMLRGKEIVTPTDIGILFTDSKKLTFERQEKLIKITEVEDKGAYEYWIDDSLSGRSYILYKYKPKPLTLEEASSKIHKLAATHPNFKPEFIVYNRHGVAAFGVVTSDKKEGEKHTFYWANPQQDDMLEIALQTMSFPLYFYASMKMGSASFIAKDGWVNFQRQFVYTRTAPTWTYYLNSEPAELLQQKPITADAKEASAAIVEHKEWPQRT